MTHPNKSFNTFTYPLILVIIIVGLFILLVFQGLLLKETAQKQIRRFLITPSPYLYPSIATPQAQPSVYISCEEGKVPYFSHCSCSYQCVKQIPEYDCDRMCE